MSPDIEREMGWGKKKKIPKDIEPAKIYRNIFEDMRSAFDLDFKINVLFMYL